MCHESEMDKDEMLPVKLNDKTLMWAEEADIEPQALQQIYGV